ncbi:MAG TPA: hypothetical protein VHL50_00975, partial [Pyrinomonadaceae bacterium]|nr:hypothetical protein [Pyrinomonadaceae bacterium]
MALAASLFRSRREWAFRLFFAALAAVFFASAAMAQQATPTPPDENPDEPVKVKTDLVTLTLTVTDLYGRYVSGLNKDAFQVSDNNQQQ